MLVDVDQAPAVLPEEGALADPAADHAPVVDATCFADLVGGEAGDLGEATVRIAVEWPRSRSVIHPADGCTAVVDVPGNAPTGVLDVSGELLREDVQVVAAAGDWDLHRPSDITSVVDCQGLAGCDVLERVCLGVVAVGARFVLVANLDGSPTGHDA